jgi:hypothetical protein
MPRLYVKNRSDLDQHAFPLCSSTFNPRNAARVFRMTTYRV